MLKDHRIDFVYYLKQQDTILNYPFIATLWDVSHKSTNGFPEHSLNKNYEIREKYYLYTLNKAFLILCESEAGATELKKYYAIYPEKIKVLPLFASNIINCQASPESEHTTLNKFNVEKEKFFIYPAQFWPHKNHYNLILAFHKLLRETGNQNLKLVLCGSDKGNFLYILDLIKSLSLTDNIIVPGFVSDESLFILYRNAIALTMPTFLGPTNIPIIEAAHLNCPVLCSDLAGHKEIMGNHALYFNPSDAEGIKAAMIQVLDQSLRSKLIESAKAHITQSPFTINNSLQVLNQIFSEVIPLRKAWGVDYFLNISFLLTIGLN
ncbi:glycosyltransferase family 4 protein [Adhaeribacter aerolatus]|uniref:glycosyltransferase family 4 protein n=1 Tax=Adhaeribacter aerolatus TaxID=670289 RepID=UPI0014794983|nr:glycosyltransferase family 1 protein [Adhaeribacter aerolatus]